MTTTSKAASQRRPERCLLRVPVQVQLSASSVEPFSGATSSNLNATGMYIRGVARAANPNEQLESGTRLSVRFTLPGESTALRVMAEVVWVNPTDRDYSGVEVLGVGVRFVDVPDHLASLIKRFIKGFRYQVLVADNDEQSTAQIKQALGSDYRVLTTQDGEHALNYLINEDIAVVMVGQRLPKMQGLDLLKELNRRYPSLPIAKIVLANDSHPSLVREFVNQGRVFHCFDKPLDPKEILPVVSAAVRTYALMVENERLNAELFRANEQLQQENSRLRGKVDRSREHQQIVGQGPAMREVLARLEQVAEFPTPVHIYGETGTGKELVARALHRSSQRKDQPFIAFNCAGVPESLVQSTLFGYRKGAFTGAVQDRKGIFQEADDGTVFLDEIGELTPTLQTSLLRVLQEGEVVPLGANKPLQVDVRIVSATHRDLQGDVKSGRFRQDLFYRLVVFEIDLPPLRERREDIPLLAQHFLTQVCEKFGKSVGAFTPECLAVLEAHDWPGNVRELENEVTRMVIRTPVDSDVHVGFLSPVVRASDLSGGLIDRYAGMSLTEAVLDTERRLISDAMARSQNVVAGAAELLGVDPSTLGKKIKRMGMTSAGRRSK